MKRLVLVLAVLMAACAAPAVAQERTAEGVVMTLSAEGWVDAKTARVVAAADVAIGSENRSTMRERVLSAFKKVSPDAEWRISRFDQSQDSAGLERWRATAEARLPEAGLGGLDARARAASEPGLQIRIETVQFVPTADEHEATLGSLRAEIYAKAKAEAERLAKVWPERGYRVARINFMDQVPAFPRPIPLTAQQDSRAATAGANAAATLAVAQKLTLRAQVTLAPSK